MQFDKDLKCLDQLINDIGGPNDARRQSGGACNLLLEHLLAARRGLLGSMAGEYKASLQYARESAACIADKGARTEMRKTLRNLTDAMSSS